MKMPQEQNELKNLQTKRKFIPHIYDKSLISIIHNSKLSRKQANKQLKDGKIHAEIIHQRGDMYDK